MDVKFNLSRIEFTDPTYTNFPIDEGRFLMVGGKGLFFDTAKRRIKLGVESNMLYSGSVDVAGYGRETEIIFKVEPSIYTYIAVIATIDIYSDACAICVPDASRYTEGEFSTSSSFTWLGHFQDTGPFRIVEPYQTTNMTVLTGTSTKEFVINYIFGIG